jgi:hypothetical protein
LLLPGDAPPGEAQLEIGMYSLSTMQRLRVRAADGGAIAGDRVLLPTAIHIAAGG